MCQPSGDEEFEIQLNAVQPRKFDSWVNIKGVPGQEGSNESIQWEDVFTSEITPDMENIRVRDPDKFVAGGIHRDPEAWVSILECQPLSSTILDWIRNKVHITNFSQAFRGIYKGRRYDSDLPPIKRFSNHGSCKKFSDFVSKEILRRVATGATRVWGKVNGNDPPHLVLPLTVEPTKPRLCLDARFLNLWMRDMPFSLDRLVDVPRYVYEGSYMTKCDDKSGYDHVSLSLCSQTYVGFEWKGFWFVCTTLPFGWKISPFIYHTIGSAATGFFRARGIPCSLYIDDRLNGELLTASGPWSVLPEARQEQYRRDAATAAVWCVLIVVTKLGYTIGLSKSVLVPSTTLEYLGFVVDSLNQCFRVPTRKIESFGSLRESILAGRKTVGVKTLQRFQGKCVSFSLAVPAAKLFIREMSSGIASASTSGLVPLLPSLREELCHWHFLDTWEGSVPWRDERHVNLSLSTDASGYGWGGVVHLASGDQLLGDYWDAHQKHLNISTKEMLALVNTVKALPSNVKDCRLDVNVDSLVLIGTWEGQGSKKSPELTKATKELYWALSDRNLQLRLRHVKSNQNEADGPSRHMSRLDSKVSEKAWCLIERAFGGPRGHSIDLMALDSNAVVSNDGCPLPHFTPCPSPNSQGVNLFAQDLHQVKNASNPYVFPPFGLIGPVLRFLYRFKIAFTIIVPELHPHPYWWPELMARCTSRLIIGARGSLDALLTPSKKGFQPIPCPCTLWACRVSF